MATSAALRRDLDRYCRDTKKLDLDYVSDKFQASRKMVTDALCEISWVWRDAAYVDGLYVLGHQDKTPWAFELASRKEKGFARGHYIMAEDVPGLLNTDVPHGRSMHISTFAHDDKWVESTEQHDSLRVSETWVKPEYIYIELDRDSYEDAKADALRIRKNLPKPVRKGLVMWFSGGKSVHIGLPASLFGNPIMHHKKACGIGKLFYNLVADICTGIRNGKHFDPWMEPTNKCKKVYKQVYKQNAPDDPQHIRQALEHFDPNLYNLNSLIRLPFSQHEKGLEKQEVCVKKGPNGQRLVRVPKPKAHKKAPEMPPLLLHMMPEALTPRRRKRRRRSDSKAAPDGFVESFYAEHLEDFDPEAANGSGWVTGLYSPFYDDTNPSVSVCVDPESERYGAYKDFGNPDHDYDFYDFVARSKNITRESAIRYVKKRTEKSSRKQR